MQKDGIKVVVIGGGTGSFAVLGGLKNYCQDITALVSMADDGGSTGELRDDLGALPPGDVRQCLVALSRSPVVRDLFDYRFEEGRLGGHSFGNLFLTALEQVTGNFAQSVETAGEVLKIVGRVVPMTLDNVRLNVERADGTKLYGQRAIEDAPYFKTTSTEKPWLNLEPSATINPEADQAIRSADLVVLAPGDLYTSLAPALIVDGVNQALESTKATVVYMCNLVTKPGHTNNMDVHDHAAEIERFCGRSLDFVLYNTAVPNKKLFEKYSNRGEHLVKAPKQKPMHYKTVGTPLIASTAVQKKKSDPLANRRSFIRHDPSLVARALMRLYFS